jgi:hypothetical protein
MILEPGSKTAGSRGKVIKIKTANPIESLDKDDNYNTANTN